MATRSSNENGWAENKKLVLRALEDLKDAKEDLTEIKTKLAVVESRLDAGRRWGITAMVAALGAIVQSIWSVVTFQK